MTELKIKRVTVPEILLLHEISTTTFRETFAAVNPAKDMKKYLEENMSVEKLTAELRNKNSAFYMALQGNIIVGYLKINFGQAQQELQNDHAVELERIYVRKEFQGNHVGQSLFEKAIQIAQEKNADYIWLGVWEKNLKAINFYKKNGFTVFDEHIFMLGDDVQTDIMMKRQLKRPAIQ